MDKQELENIPGTYVYTADRARAGYHLNMFCMSLNKASNREEFRADEASYLQKFPISEEQRQALLERDWLKLLQLGGNIYYTFKLAIFDGLTMQDVGGQMSGMSKAAFIEMMLAGGRSIEGNRSKSEQY